MGSDVLLGHDGLTPVCLREEHRTAHVAILGKSRFGKTTLLEHLVLKDMRSGTAAIVIDAHGDLSKRLVALAPFENPDRPDDLRSRVVLVEPNDERPFGLNLYECPDPTDARQVTATVGSVVEIFRKLMGAEGTGYLPLIESGLRNTARVLIANRLTMAELPLLYRDPEFRARALAILPDPGDYWREYEASSPQRQQDKREPVLNKVARFLEDDLVALMVKQSETTVPFMSVMDRGGTLLLNLAGLDRETVSFLGMVLLSVFSNLVHQREKIPPALRRRVHLYLDEYGRFATPTTKRLLEEGGKYGLGVTIAHQMLEQTPQREALDVQTLISFQLSSEDAFAVAGSFDHAPIRRKRVARQRTESQYREWEEDVWDSEESHARYDQLCQELNAVESQQHKLKSARSDARQILDALFPRGDTSPALNKFDSSDGTVNGTYVLDRLRRNGGDNRSLTGKQSVSSELRQILIYLYSKYGREPRGEEFWEAWQWLDKTATKCEQVYEEAETLLPESYKRCTELRTVITELHRQHTTRQWLTEYIGETPVKDDQGRVIYDNIEELDQSHADRRAEIANMLTQLPRYVAYCKVFGTNGKPHECRIKLLPPASLPTYEDYRRQTESEEERGRREERERSLRARGISGIRFHRDASGAIPKGFEHVFAMQELGDEVRRTTEDFARKFTMSPEARLSKARSDSRKMFGTSRSEIEEQLRKRQMRPPPDDGQPAGPTAKPKGPPSFDLAQRVAREKTVRREASEAPQKGLPPIGRRSPKR
ncbi:type IV secretory system conjugative DNA transfer family protein [Streptomyces sp. NPDC056632]|uniref:type IV secretory system conjugative DNA transfer family protein n=1 Tax=Streptomyces sp. NPDC056632 TaxID=3345884 RepID=UPI00368A0233